MPLGIQEQYKVFRDATVTGDIDLLTKVFTNPGSVTFKEQQTVAKKLGFKKGMLAAATNMIADPIVWAALFMSAKFPTTALLSGQIPHRMWGMGAEFGGISKVFNVLKTMAGTHNKTNIPRTISVVINRRADVLKIYQKYLDIVKKRPNWQEERYIVSQVLDGHAPAGVLPELEAISGQIRKDVLDPFWKMLSQSHHIVGGNLDRPRELSMARSLTMEQARKEGFRGAPPEWLRNYIAHLPIHVNSADAMFDISAKTALERLGGDRIAKEMGLAPGPGGKVGPWTTDKYNRTVSNWLEHQNWAATKGHTVYNGNLYKRTRDLPLTAKNIIGEDLFVMDLDFIMSKIFSDGARTYSLNAPMTALEQGLAGVRVRHGKEGALEWKTPTSEPPIVQIINQGIDAATGGRGIEKTTAIRDTQGKMILGKKLDMSHVSGADLNTIKSLVRDLKGMTPEEDMMFNWVWDPLVRQPMKAIQAKYGLKRANELSAAFDLIKAKKNFREKTNIMTSLMYQATLGINFGSSATNAMQTPITTLPGIGVGATMAGASEVAQRVGQMISNVSRHQREVPSHLRGWERVKAKWDTAYREAFPEMAGVPIVRPEAFDLDTAILEKQNLVKNNKFVSRDTFAKLIMQPFTTVEFMNKAVSLYGARHAFRQAYKMKSIPLPEIPYTDAAGRMRHKEVKYDSPEMDQFVDFEAKQFMRESQFPPAPGARTTWQYNHLNPMMRMFQGFATRIYNFYADSTVKGALTNAEMQQYRSMKGLASQMRSKKEGGEGVMAALGGAISSVAGGRNLGTLARTYLWSSALTNGLREVAGVDMSRALGIMSSVPVAPDWQPFAPLPTPPVVGQVFGTMSAMATRDIDKMQPLELPGGHKIPIPKTLIPGGVALSRLFRTWNQYRPDMGGRVDENERLVYKASHLDMMLAAMGIPLEKARHEKLMLNRLRDNRRVVRDMRRQFTVANSNLDYDRMGSLQEQWKKKFPDMPPLSTATRYVNLYRANQHRTRVMRMLKTMGQSAKYLEKDIYDIDPDLYSTPFPTSMTRPVGAAFGGP